MKPSVRTGRLYSEKGAETQKFAESAVTALLSDWRRVKTKDGRDPSTPVRAGSPPLHCKHPRRFRLLVASHLQGFFDHSLRLLDHLSAELLFQRGELGLDVFRRFALADDFFTVTAQEVVDGFDADPDGASGLVLVEILEAEVRGTGLLDDALDHAVDGRVVTAFEAGDFEGNQVGMACCELRRPDFVVGAAGI